MAISPNRRKKLLAPHSLGRGTAAEVLNRRRFAKRISRKENRKSFKGGPLRHFVAREVIQAQYKSSPLLDELVPNRAERWRNPVLRKVRWRPINVVLSNLSFIDNAEQTLRSLTYLAELELVEAEVRIFFKDAYIRDISPYLVMAQMWRDMAPIFSGGYITQPVQKVFEAVGLREPLGMAPFANLEDLSDVWAFRVRYWHEPEGGRTAKRVLTAQKREKVADAVCDWVDDCIGIEGIGQELTNPGKSRIANTVGEMLCNAERHSDLHGHQQNWSIAGFMARRTVDAGEHVHTVSLSIVNTGPSIAETIRTGPAKTMNELDEYVKLHRGGLQSEDTLTTVYALQDFVTRAWDADADGRGGVGFQDVFEFVGDLGGTSHQQRKPNVTIVSGRTCISVTGPYIDVAGVDADDAREVWFNGRNDPAEAPDSTCVRDLPKKFPGTIISISFVLDAEYLTATVS